MPSSLCARKLPLPLRDRLLAGTVTAISALWARTDRAGLVHSLMLRIEANGSVVCDAEVQKKSEET
jgi:hypothetical protein